MKNDPRCNKPPGLETDIQNFIGSMRRKYRKKYLYLEIEVLVRATPQSIFQNDFIDKTITEIIRDK